MRPELRQNTVAWWAMRIGVVVALLFSVSLFLFVPVVSLVGVPAWLSGPLYLLALLGAVWVVALALLVLVGGSWGGFAWWEARRERQSTAAERRRYEQLDGEDVSLPASAWGDVENEEQP